MFGLFSGREYQRKRKQTVALIERHGFSLQAAELRVVQPLLPWAFAEPDRCTVYASGSIANVTIKLFECEHDYRDREGRSQTSAQLIVAAQHPAIVGGAQVHPDLPNWGGMDAFFDTLFWVPPFIALRGLMFLMETLTGSRKLHDFEVGHVDFDRLYKVHASDGHAAQQGIPPAFRELLSRSRLKASFDLRRGLMLFCAYEAQFTPMRIGHALSPIGGLVRALTAGGPAYR